MSKAHSNSALGFSDILAGGVLFLLITWLLKVLLDSAVPGLLKPETLTVVRISGIFFLVFWAVAGNYLIKPYLDLTIEREERTTGDQAAAAEKKRESRLLAQQIDKELKKTRLEAIKERDKITDGAKRRAQQVVEAAQFAAQEDRKKAQNEIELLIESASTEVAGEADKLARLVVDRALASEPKLIIH